jgi:hypothetical protein
MIVTRGLGSKALSTAGLGFTETYTVVAQFEGDVYLVEYEKRFCDVLFESRLYLVFKDQDRVLEVTPEDRFYTPRADQRSVSILDD